MKLLLICQACAAEQIISKNVYLRWDFALARFGTRILINKKINIVQKPIVLDVFDSNINKWKRRKRDIKIYDEQFNINTDKLTNTQISESCNDSILDPKLESQVPLEWNTSNYELGMIVENISCLRDNTDELDDFAYFRFCMIEFGLDCCATSHIMNDLSLFIPDTIIELKNNRVKGISRTVIIPKRGVVEIFIFYSDRKKHKHILWNVSYVPDSPKNLISISQ